MPKTPIFVKIEPLSEADIRALTAVVAFAENADFTGEHAPETPPQFTTARRKELAVAKEIIDTLQKGVKRQKQRQRAQQSAINTRK